MKTIDTKTRIPDPENKGKFLYKPRKMEEVFRDVQAALKGADLVPDENLDLAFDCRYGAYKEADFPEEISDLLCTNVWGGSEGIYLDVTIKAYIAEEKSCKLVPFITEKSLGETKQSFDRMQYIAGYIYQLIMGAGTNHARYMLVRNQELEKSHALLMDCVNREMTELMKQKLYGGQQEPAEYGDELALKALITKVLSQSRLPAEKISELLDLENILDVLYSFCRNLTPVDQQVIEEALASCPIVRSEKRSEA